MPLPAPSFRTGIAFVGLALLVYGRVLGTGFVADDFQLVHAVLERGVYTAWAGFFRPVTVLSFALDASLFGTSAPGFHVTNVVLHGVAGALLSGVLTRIFEAFSLVRAREVACLAGVSFVVLPNHTEAVAWISGRGDLLATVFGLGATLAFLEGMQRQRLRDGAIAATLVGCALFSKEIGIVWPPVLLVLALCIGRVRGERMAASTKRMLAFVFLMLALYLVVRATMLRDLVGGYGASRHVPALDLGLLHAFAKYVVRAFVPATRLLDGAAARVALTALVVALVVLAVPARAPRRVPLSAMLAVCFLLSIAPTLTLGLNYRDTEGERFLYLPSLFTVALPFVAIAPRLDGLRARVFVVALLAAQTCALVALGEGWRRAAELTERTVASLAARDDGRTAVLNVPDNYSGAYVFRSGVVSAVQMRGAPGNLYVFATHDVLTPESPYSIERGDGTIGIRLRPGESPQYVERYGEAPRIDGERLGVRFDDLPEEIDTLLVWVGGRGDPFRAFPRPR